MARKEEKPMAANQGGEVVPMVDPAAAPAPVVDMTVEVVENPNGQFVIDIPAELRDKLMKEEPMVMLLARVMRGEMLQPAEVHATLERLGVRTVRSRVPHTVPAMPRPVVVGDASGDSQSSQTPQSSVAQVPVEQPVPTDLVRLTDAQKYILDAFYAESMGPLLDLVGQKWFARHQEMMGPGMDLGITLFEEGYRVAVMIPPDGPKDSVSVLSKVSADWDQLGQACIEAVMQAEDQIERISREAKSKQVEDAE